MLITIDDVIFQDYNYNKLINKNSPHNFYDVSSFPDYEIMILDSEDFSHIFYKVNFSP